MTTRLTLPLLRQAARRSSAAHTAVRGVGALAPTNLLSPSNIVTAPPRPYCTTPSPRMAGGNDDSHSDFAPKRKSVDDADGAAIQDMIRDHVTSNHIMLYMKGTPSMPMCGFSATVVGILQKEGINFSSVNVLDYPTVREGVKKFSEWPTIPQLYVDGEFIGGCDIITSMSESGELSELLKEGGEEK